VLEELPDAPNPDAPAESETPPADDNFKEEFDKLAKLDEEWRDYMAQSSSYSAARRKRKKNASSFRFHPDAGNAATAFDGTAQSERARRGRSQTAELIIGNIDDNGFFTDYARGNGAEHRNTAGRFRKHADAHPEFPSAGVGARDLRECLLIQLKREEDKAVLNTKLWRSHAGFGQATFSGNCAPDRDSVEQVQKVRITFAQLDPRPGAILPRRRKIMSCRM